MKPRIHNTNLISFVKLLTIVVSISMLFAPLCFATVKPFPFEDVNNNGVYDPGIDKDITVLLMSTGSFSTPNSIVIPDGATGIQTSNPNGIALVAGKNITVSNSYLITSGKYAGIYLYTENGTVTISDGTLLKSAYFVAIDSEKDVIIGSYASIYAKGEAADIASRSGNISLMARAIVYGYNDLYLTAEKGEVTVSINAQLKSPKGFVDISGAADLTINGSRFEALGAHVVTSAHMLEFRDNTVKILSSQGWVYLEAKGSTVDITGTQFQGLDPRFLTINADVVIK
jgi:hypothetical protein